MEWTSNDVNWDPIVNWLRTSVEHFQNPTPHYILLWLITDKIHGFWNRNRDKSLDTDEMIDLLIVLLALIKFGITFKKLVHSVIFPKIPFNLLTA